MEPDADLFDDDDGDTVRYNIAEELRNVIGSAYSIESIENVLEGKIGADYQFTVPVLKKMLDLLKAKYKTRVKTSKTNKKEVSQSIHAVFSEIVQRSTDHHDGNERISVQQPNLHYFQQRQYFQPPPGGIHIPYQGSGAPAGPVLDSRLQSDRERFFFSLVKNQHALPTDEIVEAIVSFRDIPEELSEESIILSIVSKRYTTTCIICYIIQYIVYIIHYI